jgi:iron complex transport system substrate-binding protein
MTVTDDEGVTMTLKAAPTRIVTFAPANTEILFALGLGNRVVGVSGPYDDYPLAAKRIERVGGATGVQPNLEKVIALHPDLVLATSGGQDWKKRLRGLGVPVFSINAMSLPDVFHDIDTVGTITGVAARAKDLTRSLARRSKAIERRVSADPAVTCFYEVYFQPPVYTVGPGSFVFDLLNRAGCDPVTSNLHRQYPELSVEALVKDDPRVYLLDSLSASSPAAVARRPGFDALSAVRHHRVVVIPSDLVTRPGPRIVRGLRALAVALHPDAFR